MTEVTTSDPVEEPTGPVEPGIAQNLGWALMLITVAQLMVVLDATIANIALPYIGADLDISGVNLTWIVTGYALAFGGFLLLGGRLGDLYGRRRVFMAGLIVFAFASALGGVAQSEALLLGARGLQGFGAALASPAALGLIITTFPAGPKRNQAMAVYAAMSGAGAAVGLILGGWLTGLDSIVGIEMSGWRLTFLINTPIGLAAAALAPRFLPESDKHAGELDVPGAIAGTGALLALVYGLTRAGDHDYGWDDQWTIASLVAAAVLMLAFIVVEARVEHPLMPFRVFASRTRASSFVAMMLMPAAMFSMFYFLSLFIQLVMGYSPLETGFAFLPFSFGIAIGATIASKVVPKIDPRWLAGTGTIAATIALIGFSRLTVDDSGTSILQALANGSNLGDSVNYWTSIFPFIVLMAFGMGFVFVPLTVTAVHHLRHEDSGIGSGVLNTMQQVGGALGLAILSTVGAHFSADHSEKIAPVLAKAGLHGDQLDGAVFLGSFTEGATSGFLVGAGMMFAAALVILFLLNVKAKELEADPEHAMVG